MNQTKLNQAKDYLKRHDVSCQKAHDASGISLHYLHAASKELNRDNAKYLNRKKNSSYRAVGLTLPLNQLIGAF